MYIGKNSDVQMNILSFQSAFGWAFKPTEFLIHDLDLKDFQKQ